MRIVNVSAILGLVFLAISPLAHSQAHLRQVIDFDPAWRFTTGDPAAAETAAFDDAAWQALSVPHDWSIAGPVDKANSTGQGGAYFPNGVGWYRRHFALAPEDAHRHVYIVFDGVMANSDVWINGTHLGKRPYGYVSFYYELTGHVNFGPAAQNVLAVRCDNAQQPASRWYEGAGIYRPVRLVITNDVHIEPWGAFVTTPKASGPVAMVKVETDVRNDSAIAVNPALAITLLGPDGKFAGKASLPTQPIAANTSAHFSANIPVTNPDLWDISHPAMYRATVEVLVENSAKAKPLDEDQIPFGIREFHFDANTGFYLNGRNFKLKGAAMHIDGGAVGIAVPTAVYEQRLLALRALGVNAVRTAHNPPSPDFLDLCDRLGFLVMDEMFDQWTVAKNPYDYHLFFEQWSLRDTADTVRRDRNHPSIILWSAGNEIHDTPKAELANRILTGLVKTFHDNDPTRPVTQALFRPNVSHDYDNGLADLLDVVGQNYRENELLAAHAQKPTRKILGTENTHERPVWLAMRDHPEYSGQFLWVGVDYLGEAGEAGGWPILGNGAGLLDHTGAPRGRGFERESWWQTAPNVHIVRRIAATEKAAVDPGYETAPVRFRQTLYPDWTPKDANPHVENVEVYTNAQAVDLLLNGKSLGIQPLHADASPITWKVPFEAGTLTAVAYNGAKQVAKDELRTAGKPTHLRLTPEHATVSTNPQDALFVTAEVLDDNNVAVPDATSQLHFAVTGPAQIRATDSASLVDHDPFAAPDRHAFQGRAIAILTGAKPGPVTLTVSSDGLKSSTIPLTVTAAPPTHLRSF